MDFRCTKRTRRNEHQASRLYTCFFSYYLPCPGLRWKDKIHFLPFETTIFCPLGCDILANLDRQLAAFKPSVSVSTSDPLKAMSSPRLKLANGLVFMYTKRNASKLIKRFLKIQKTVSREPCTVVFELIVHTLKKPKISDIAKNIHPNCFFFFFFFF